MVGLPTKAPQVNLVDINVLIWLVYTCVVGFGAYWVDRHVLHVRSFDEVGSLFTAIPAEQVFHTAHVPALFVVLNEPKMQFVQTRLTEAEATVLTYVPGTQVG